MSGKAPWRKWHFPGGSHAEMELGREKGKLNRGDQGRRRVRGLQGERGEEAGSYLKWI